MTKHTHPTPHPVSPDPDFGEAILTAYLLGELDATEAAALEARLADDEALRAEADLLRATIDLLRGEARADAASDGDAATATPHLRPEQKVALREAAASATTADDPTPRGPARVISIFSRGRLALAACFVLVLAVVTTVEFDTLQDLFGPSVQSQIAASTQKLTGNNVGGATQKLTGSAVHDELLTVDLDGRVAGYAQGAAQGLYETALDTTSRGQVGRGSRRSDQAAAPAEESMLRAGTGVQAGRANVMSDELRAAGEPTARRGSPVLTKPPVIIISDGENNEFGRIDRNLHVFEGEYQFAASDDRQFAASASEASRELGQQRAPALTAPATAPAPARPATTAPNYNETRGTTSAGDVWRFSDEATVGGVQPGSEIEMRADAIDLMEAGKPGEVQMIGDSRIGEAGFQPRTRFDEGAEVTQATRTRDIVGARQSGLTSTDALDTTDTDGRVDSATARANLMRGSASGTAASQPAEAKRAETQEEILSFNLDGNIDTLLASVEKDKSEVAMGVEVEAVPGPAPQATPVPAPPALAPPPRQLAMASTAPEDSDVGVAARRQALRGSRDYYRIPRPDPSQFEAMYFVDPGVYPTHDPAADPLSTFGLDVDTGSFTLARNYLDRGALPPREAIRPEEFINALPIDYPEPTTSPLGVNVDAARSPFDERASVLRVGVQGRTIDASERPVASLTFVIDVSGSMNRENRLGLVKQALTLLLDQLVEGDRVAIVVYSSQPRLVLPHTGIEDRATIQSAIDSLAPGGSTNLAGGLNVAYMEANRAFQRDGINRIVLCSDGVANVGLTNPDEILTSIGESARRGIQLTTVGFGMGNYNDALMERLANTGDGQYAYVDRLDEARRLFVEELQGTLMTLARNAKIQVEFNPEVVRSYRLIGYENRAIADRDFRNDAIDAGELGAGHTVTALYEVRLLPHLDRIDFETPPVAATARLRWLDPRTDAPTEVEQTIAYTALAADFATADAGLQAAAVAGEFAEVLRGSVAGDPERLDRLARLMSDTRETFPASPAIESMIAMIDRTAALWAQRQRP